MEQERRDNQTGCVFARRFADEQSARNFYESVRDKFLAENTVRASVFCFTLDGIRYVAVIGDQPLSRHELAFIEETLGTSGDPAELPDDAVKKLRSRRKEATNLGFDYVERRTPHINPN